MFRPAAVALLILSAPGRAAEPPDPLRFIPDSAGVVVKVEHPRRLAEVVTALDAVREAQELAPVREAFNLAPVRRAFQLLAFAEAELGAKWPDLLDQLASGGVAVAAQLGDNAPALFVAQGTDDRHMARAFALLVRLLDDELARQGSKDRAVTSTYNGAETVRVGTELHAARIGATYFLSNKADALRAGIDLARTDAPAGRLSTRPSVLAARKLLPRDPLAWAWVDFAAVKGTKQAKDFFDATRKDFFQTLVAGSTIDCLRRSDFMAAGLYREPNGFRLAVRLPAGRGGFPPEFALHIPPKGQSGSLPLLEPPGVLYSQSFHLDVGYLWKHRDTLINEQTRKDLEKAERDLAKVMPGSVKPGQLLEMWGAYHRLVVVNQEKMPYATQPAERLPAFGYVGTMRDPRFGRSAESAVRAAGVLLSIQYGLKAMEETHDGVKLIAYRFPEGKPFPDDPGNVRFNFEPCLAVVGDQVVAASTRELGRKLIAEVKRTADLAGSPAVWRAKGYARAAAEALTVLPDPLVTEAVLRQGVGIEEARKQVDALAALVARLGTARVEVDETDADYRLDVVWDLGK